MKVLVLGAGFGGLEATSVLSAELGQEAEIVLIDKTEGFVFGFSKLDVMFGRETPESVLHPYRDLTAPGVRFVRSTIRSIDPRARRVETDDGTFDADFLLIALGADLDLAGTPGLEKAGHEFYTEQGAFSTRKVLQEFEGGRVIIAVTSTPYKCPPAPSEAAFLLHDFLTDRGLIDRSEISVVMPMPVPIPPSPDASEKILAAFADLGIAWYPDNTVASVDPTRRIATLTGGEKLPFDLYLAVPRHKVPDVVEETGMCVDGWIPVDPYTLETNYPGVYAVGDVTSVGTPKAGVFAEGQAAVVADQIVAKVRGGTARRYDGSAACYIEFGHDEVGMVQVTFRPGSAPFGFMSGPSPELAREKADFATTRIARWFGG